MFDQLPNEIVANIIDFMDLKSYLSFKSTNYNYNNFLSSEKDMNKIKISYKIFYYDQQINLNGIDYYLASKDKIQFKQNDIIIYCNDCSAIIKVKNLEKHKSNCIQKSPIKCSICGVIKKMHQMKDCPFKMIKCIYCNQEIYKFQYKNHDILCGNTEDKCEICNLGVKRRGNYTHKYECIDRVDICSYCGKQFKPNREPINGKTNHSNICNKCSTDYINNKINLFSSDNRRTGYTGWMWGADGSYRWVSGLKLIN